MRGLVAAARRISASAVRRDRLHLRRRRAARALRAAINRIRDEAEHGRARRLTELFLTDEHVGAGPGRASPCVLAAAAVHTHLVRRGLRSYSSINVRSAECLDHALLSRC